MLIESNRNYANINSDAHLSAWNYIVEQSEEEIFKLAQSEHQTLFNEAIEHLNDSYGRLIHCPAPLIGKFIRCVPLECIKHPEFHKLLSLIQANGGFYEVSLWNYLPFYRTPHPELLKALEDIIVSGKETLAIAILEHGMPFTSETLMLACSHDQSAVAHYLIEKGNVTSSMGKSEYISVLEIASKENQFEVIQAILKTISQPEKLLNKLIISKNEVLAISLINKGIPFSSNVLLTACDYGLSNLAECLIVKGADINTKNKYGRSLLYVASQQHYPDVVIELIRHGAMLEVQEMEPFFDSTAPFDFDEDVRVELAKSCIKTEPSITYENFKKFDIQNEERLVEIIKTFELSESINLVGNLGLNNEKLLTDFAMFCARKNGIQTFFQVEKFNIKNKDIFKEIIQLCFIQSGIDLLMQWNCNFPLSHFPEAFILDNSDSRLEKVIKKYLSVDRYKFQHEAYENIRCELKENFSDHLKSLGLMQLLDDIEGIENTFLRADKIRLILEILFFTKMVLEDGKTNENQNALFKEMFAFGRPDLILPVFRKAVTLWNHPDYIQVAKTFPAFDLPWRQLLNQILINLILNGVDQSTLFGAVYELEKLQDFKNGKNVHVFIDTLIQLTNIQLEPAEIEFVLRRVFEESKASTHEQSASRAIFEGEEAKLKIQHAKNNGQALGKKSQIDCQNKIERMNNSNSSMKELGSAILLNLNAIVAILDFEGGVKRLVLKEQTIKGTLELVFKENLQSEMMEGFAEKYDHKFMQSRHPTAFVTYMAKINTLNDQECSDCLEEYLISVLNGTFEEWRYSLNNNPHFEALDETSPDLISNWRTKLAPFPIAFESIDAGKNATWVQEKLLLLDGINLLQFNYLKRFFDSKKNKKNSVRAECSQEWENIKKKNIKNNETHSSEKNKLLLQELLFQFMEVYDSTKQIGLLRKIKRLFKEFKFNPVNKQKVDLDIISSIDEKINLLQGVSKGIVVIESEDPLDLLYCGSDSRSCLKADGFVFFSKGLLGYLKDPKIHLLLVKDAEGQIMARTLLRLGFLKGTSTPALHRDSIYMNFTSPQYEKAINAMAIRKAESLGVQVFCYDNEEGKTSIEFLEGPAPWEYYDGAGRACEKGINTEYNCSELVA
ncbi:MAG TPA: ankyrin repeat domain-containing protein [Parachlamydiaceae bacterium]|nr:ankyrin repeat domain-containing protein [Parachlamydiaceae bacterium]